MSIVTRKSRRWFAATALATFPLIALSAGSRPTHGSAAQQPGAGEKPYAIEYYYKVKWGHADEFIALFKKNHYPLLKKEIELGRIVKVFAEVPRYHATEDGRWDFRTTIVFKNAQIANDNFESAPLLKQLFPDQDAYQKEEQRRFEILDAHWDLPVKDYDLDSR
ncbi:MAG TPA: hypothetical protein VKQ28_03355 [Candidatus Acidoferrum sp.]|nr:hypothetical protein [Candidatus Acidoferrum sp.]